MVRKIRKRLTDKEREELVRKIEEYSEANKVSKEAAAKALGFHKSAYYANRARLQEKTKKPNGEMEFPLAVIPERPKVDKVKVKEVKPKDKDKDLAILLLSAAIRLIER
jgi:hypothetical protein